MERSRGQRILSEASVIAEAARARQAELLHRKVDKKTNRYMRTLEDRILSAASKGKTSIVLAGLLTDRVNVRYPSDFDFHILRGNNEEDVMVFSSLHKRCKEEGFSVKVKKQHRLRGSVFKTITIKW